MVVDYEAANTPAAVIHLLISASNPSKAAGELLVPLLDSAVVVTFFSI